MNVALKLLFSGYEMTIMMWQIHVTPKQILCAEFNPTPDDQKTGGEKMFLPKAKQMEIWLNAT